MIDYAKISLALLVLLIFSTLVVAQEVIIFEPSLGHINASAIDQPELDAVLVNDGNVIYDNGLPVILDVFIDTGASSFVISNLSAVGFEYEPITGYGYVSMPSLGLDGSPVGEFLGEFTEVGIGGQELGDVTKLLGIKVLNAPQGSSLDPADFTDFGQYSTWVRRAPGAGEVVSMDMLTLVDPINVIGMPLISQYVLAIDVTPLAQGERIAARLLAPRDSSTPQTNITFDLQMENLVGEPAEGEVLPTCADNPMVPNVTISHTRGGVTRTDQDNRWLFDTGAGSSFLSFAKAQAIGLIGESYADLNDFLPDHKSVGGLYGEVGGIGGGIVQVPILQLEQISIPAREGFDVIWLNVDIMVIDIEDPTREGEMLDGVLGMNMLVPALTIDPDDPLGSLDEITPGFFEYIVFDSTNPLRPELKLWSELAPTPLAGDATRNGVVDAADLGRLLANWGNSSDWDGGDFNGDGVTDGADLGMMLARWKDRLFPPPPITGDFNLDGYVDGADLGMLLARWKDAGGETDINDDGIVDGVDLGMLLARWGNGTPPAAPSPIPEPASLALLAIGAAGVFAKKRRR